VLEAEKQDKARALLEIEQEKERRRGLLVRAGISTEEADVFAKAIANSPRRREARMLWGPWKGVAIRMIPKPELQKIVRQVRRSTGNEWLITAIRRELTKVVA
jgi:hypothetical protein